MSGEGTVLGVADAYDLWSDGYDTYDNAMVYMADFAFRRHLQKRIPTSLFEFGCGTGRNLALCDAFGVPHIAGSDFSEGMLTKARTRPGSDAWHLQRADLLEKIAAPDRRYDLVLFCLVLEHVSHLTNAFKEAKRLLGENGEILVFEIHPAFFANWKSGHFVHAGEEIRIPGFNHAHADYVAAAEATGLSLAECIDWTPSMAEGPLPYKVFKRGLDQQLLLQMVFR